MRLFFLKVLTFLNHRSCSCGVLWQVSQGHLECAEYADAIFESLSNNERMYQVRLDYFRDVQEDINPAMRSILVDWLFDAADEMEFERETVHLAVNYLDRFLELCCVRRNQLQLVGVCCFLLAAKFEEKSPPDVKEIVWLCCDTYTREQVIRMESIIINSLEFRLAVATRLPFLHRLSSIQARDDRVQILSSFLADLSLLQFSLARYGSKGLNRSELVNSNYTKKADQLTVIISIFLSTFQNTAISLGSCLYVCRKKGSP